MSTTVETTVEEEKILYDLTVPCEWPEVVTTLPTQEGVSLWRTLADITKGFVKFTVDKLQYPLRLVGGQRGVPTALSAVLETRLPWKIAITSDGSLLAVLKENQLEIRSIVDEFESVLTACQVPEDPLPSHRKLVWDSEGTLLAIGLSSGAVLVFSSSGRLLTQLIDRVAHSDVGTLSPLSGLIFLPGPSTREEENTASLLCVLYYGKNLETYEIREEGSPVFLHSFSFSDYFPNGVDSLLYHCSLNILIVGAASSDGANSVVVSGWRLIDGAPYWAPKLGQEGILNKKPKSIFSGLRQLGRPAAQKGSGVVSSMSVSPEGQLLATLEVSGQLSIWDLPSLKLNKTWSQEEQPFLTQHGMSHHGKQKAILLPVEVSWWSDDTLIIVDTAGHVTVPSVASLRNLLGDHPEPGRAITPACNGQFFILDCESSKTSVSARFRVPSLSEESEPEDDPTSQSEPSFSKATSGLLKQVMFFLTESDRFRPPKKKPKIVKSRYSLACLKSMPPEECYERKMLNEEYGEALLLAQQYGLNCDLVYLRQWRSYSVSVATIHDYLSKISQRSEVLQECMNRVPEDYITTKQLLQYGLSRTSFKELKLAGGDDSMESLDSEESDEDDITLSEMEAVISGWKKLNSDQVSICQYRHLLLTYLDRLATYEVSLGGPRAADEKFSSSVYEEFRSANLVHSAIEYARDGDWQAVEALFTYHGQVVLPHRLAILSNFPETLSPESYEHLLPAINESGGIDGWEVDTHSENDWVRGVAISRVCALPNETHTNTGEFIYQDNPDWTQYRSPETSDVLTTWYKERATEIEECSGQVDCALRLIEFGIDKGVEGLNILHHHLQTLYMLVYKCNADSRLTLGRLQAMTNLDILSIMLTDCSGLEFVKTFRECVNPFLSRLEVLNPGVGDVLLTEYLVQLAKIDLEPCSLLFQDSAKQSVEGGGLFKSVNQILTLALKVVYACERSDQLSVADSIVDSLPSTGPVSRVSGDLADLVAQANLLKDHLIVLDTLQEYGVLKPVHFVRDIQTDPVQVEQLMVKLTRVANRRDPPLSESKWRRLLQDLLSLRSRAFTCVDISTCYKVFAESLLCSGKETNIELASQLLTLSPGSQKPSRSSSFNYRLSHKISCDLVLNAAREYFNSAASLMDEDMNLARCCLDLFSQPTAAVQVEWNLIASLSLLDDFGVNILPLQVRLTDNKLDIVRSVLDSSPTAYKKFDKISRLSRLLDGAVSDDPEESLIGKKLSPSEGHSLILIVLSALQENDMRLAEKLCQRLVKMKFAPAWEVCRKVSTDSNSLGLTTKINLMNFSLTFCPPEEIEHTIKLRQKLQVQSLYADCVERAAVSSSESKSLGRVDTSQIAGTVVKGLVDKGVKGIVKSAGAVQQLIKTRQASDLSSSKPVTGKPSGHSVSTVISELSKMAESASSSATPSFSITSHPFYSTTTSDSTNGEAGTKSYFENGDWGKPSDVSVKLAVNQALLYALRVANDMAEKDDKNVECTKILLDLAEEYSSVDTHLMLGYLLALPQADSASTVFSTLPKTRQTLQLALYYISLHIYVHLLPTLQPKDFNVQQHPYLHPPAEMVDYVMHQVMSSDTTLWPEALQPLVQLFHKYREMEIDLEEANELLGLGLGIDIDQFEGNTDYKHSIIIMLARTLSEKGFSIACKLAQRHNVPDWELYMELLDTLLTTTALESHEIPRRIKDKGIMNILLSNPQQTCDRLCGGTYDKLRGTNLTTMLSYYTSLQQCLDKGATMTESSIPVATHIKLLKKFKSNVSGIDYKMLMTGEGDPMDTLGPALTANNVHIVAKLADKIPMKSGGCMNADTVFRTYTEILFWKGGDKQRDDPDLTPKWVHRYEACQEFLMKLGVAETRQFVKNIVFSDQSIKLGLSTRLELVKRSLKMCQTRLKQTTVDSGFQQLKSELEVLLNHLKILSGKEFENVPAKYSIDEEKWKGYFTELDLSLSEPSKVHSLCLKMLFELFPVELVHSVLSLTHSVSPNKLSVAGLTREALEGCVQVLSHDQSPSDSSDSVQIERLERILASVSDHESKGGDLVTSSQLLEVLQPFCSNASFNTHTRRAVLQLVEKYLYLSDEDVGLLLLYQTQSILSADFSVEVTIEKLSTAESRDKFFSQILKQATDVEKVCKLLSLLEAWTNSSSVSTQSWVDLLLVAAEMSTAVNIVPVIRAGLTNIPSEVDERLVELLLIHDLNEALKLVLVSSNQDKLRSILKTMNDVSLPADPNLMELIISSNTVAVFKQLNTNVYQQLCEHLKSSLNIASLDEHLFSRYFQCSETELPSKLNLDSPAVRVKGVAHQLYKEGLVLDAGSLLLKLQAFHPTLSTFNGAVAYAHRLFLRK